MQSTSSLYQSIIQEDGHYFEVKLNIDGTDYGEDVIFSVKSDSRMFNTEPTIGGAYSGTLEFSILGSGSGIPRMACVKPYFRAIGENSQSEWYQKGLYFIDTRSVSQNAGGVTVFTATCYDAMLKANAPYGTSSLTWPADDIDVVDEIASKIGLTVDSTTRSMLIYRYDIQIPTQYTMREVLGYIGAMYAANWIIRDNGTLQMIPLNWPDANPTAIGGNVTNLNVSPARPAYTKVALLVDDTNAYESGTTDDNVMEAVCPYATQAIANDVYSKLSSYVYQPFEAVGCWTNPALELGDAVSFINSTVGYIYARTINFGRGMVMDLSAPNDNDIDHEYEYESPTERNYKRVISGINNSISMNSNGITILSEKLGNFGGRNLIINTYVPRADKNDDLPRFVGQAHSTYTQNWTPSVAEHGFRLTKGTSTSTPYVTFGSGTPTSEYCTMNGLTAGETYTVSFGLNAKVLTTQTEAKWRIVFAAWDSSNNRITYDDARLFGPIHNGVAESFNIIATVTIPANAAKCSMQLGPYYVATSTYPPASDYDATDYYELTNIKFEVGEVATAWTPAPEDQAWNGALNGFGGRNLIKNTLEPSVDTLDDLPRFVGQVYHTMTNNMVPSVAEHGVRVTVGTISATPRLTFGYTVPTSDRCTMNGLTPGETYTFSSGLKAKVLSSTVKSARWRLVFASWDAANNQIESAELWLQPIQNGVEETFNIRVSHTIASNAAKCALQIAPDFVEDHTTPTSVDYLSTDYWEMTNIKFEQGEVATAWSPAPEDQVGNNEIISKINVSPENITISANKIDLQGYVTLTDLSTSGQTVINGANITTGLIKDAANKNSWNLDTGAFTITNGTINITTNPSSTDYIRLNWFNNDFSSMRILELYPGDNSTYGYGRIRMGVRGYNPSLPDTYTLTFSEISHQWQGMVYGQEQYVNGAVSSRTTIASCTANGVSGFWGNISSAGLTFSTGGTVTATYPATGLPMLNGAADNTTQSGAVIAVPYVTHSTLGITTSATDFEVSKAWAKYVAAQYPNKEYCVFIGTVAAGTVRNAQMMAYNTNNKNADGIPNICNVQLSRYTGGMFYYTCVNGTFSRVAFLDKDDLRFMDSSGVITNRYPATCSAQAHDTVAASGGTKKITFSGNTLALIGVSGGLGASYGMWTYAGYGVGTARQHINAILGPGSNVSCAVDSATQSVTVTNSGSASVGVYVWIMGHPTGSVPTIT